MADQPQTLARCADLREECRNGIFGHIDERHKEVMEQLTGIRETLAYQKGRANGTAAHAPVRAGLSWPVVIKIVVLLTGLGAGVGTAVGFGCYAARTGKPAPISPAVTP